MPNQIIRMTQLGLEDVLQAQTIWTCASCQTCLSRCPKGVDVPRVMEALRQMAMERGATPLYVAELRPDLVADAPQMAIIGGFRKFTA
jgi:heterodisulfide reductase subunit C